MEMVMVYVVPLTVSSLCMSTSNPFLFSFTLRVGWEAV